MKEYQLDRWSTYQNVFYISKDQQVNSELFTIQSPRNESIENILIEGVNNFEFLPFKIQNQFPNLIGFFCKDGKVKKISKNNFSGLRKLKEIELDQNQIEEIEENSFDDLESLEKLHLSFNKI